LDFMTIVGFVPGLLKCPAAQTTTSLLLVLALFTELR